MVDEFSTEFVDGVIYVAGVSNQTGLSKTSLSETTMTPIVTAAAYAVYSRIPIAFCLLDLQILVINVLYTDADLGDDGISTRTTDEGFQWVDNASTGGLYPMASSGSAFCWELREQTPLPSVAVDRN
ncbi:hypothetical protein AKJ16_DCAP18371 [Drosera capensis]